MQISLTKRELTSIIQQAYLIEANMSDKTIITFDYNTDNLNVKVSNMFRALSEMPTKTDLSDEFATSTNYL